MATVPMVKNLKGSLSITCKMCGHKVTWSVGEAERRMGPYTLVWVARRVVTCTACGTRGQALFS